MIITTLSACKEYPSGQIANVLKERNYPLINTPPLGKDERYGSSSSQGIGTCRGNECSRDKVVGEKDDGSDYDVQGDNDNDDCVANDNWVDDSDDDERVEGKMAKEFEVDYHDDDLCVRMHCLLSFS